MRLKRRLEVPPPFASFVGVEMVEKINAENAQKGLKHVYRGFRPRQVVLEHFRKRAIDGSLGFLRVFDHF